MDPYINSFSTVYGAYHNLGDDMVMLSNEELWKCIKPEVLAAIKKDTQYPTMFAELHVAAEAAELDNVDTIYHNIRAAVANAVIYIHTYGDTVESLTAYDFLYYALHTCEPTSLRDSCIRDIESIKEYLGSYVDYSDKILPVKDVVVALMVGYGVTKMFHN